MNSLLRAVKQLISLIALIILLIFLIVCNCSFNTHFVSYILQFVCVPFAGRRRWPIAVEC